MRSLVWKEWRQTRCIAFWFLFMHIAASLYGKFMLAAEIHIVAQLMVLSLLATVLGARAFAGERQTGAMEFLAAQPLRKTHLWTTKALWGLAVLLVMVVVSAAFDFGLMVADRFYTAAYLAVHLPLSWYLLCVLAMYAVGSLASALSDKTMVAVGIVMIVWTAIWLLIAAIDHVNPHFFQFANESWGVPLALSWFIIVVGAVSFAVFTWREVWPNRPRALKTGATVVGVGTVAVLLILSSANVPPERVTCITAIYPAGRSWRTATCVFSGVIDEEKALGHWQIDLDGANFTKFMEPPPGFRKHPSQLKRNIVMLRPGRLVEKLDSGQHAGGYLVEMVSRYHYGFPSIARRLRTMIYSRDGQVSWLRGLLFVEERPDGGKILWEVGRGRRELTKSAQGAEYGDFEALSPDGKYAIYSSPAETKKEGRVRLVVLRRYENHIIDDVEMTAEVRDDLSFVTATVVRYTLEGKTYLANIRSLDEPFLEVPRRVVARGPEAVRRLAENVARKAQPSQKAENVLESVAAGWGADMPEELFDEAIFHVPRDRQIVYIKKENEQQSSLWLIDTKSGESTRILDDIDVTSPAVPKALIGCIMDDYFVFVRDARTIWTYRDGQLTEIFPPQR